MGIVARTEYLRVWLGMLELMGEISSLISVGLHSAID